MTSDVVHGAATVRRIVVEALRDPCAVPALPPAQLDLAVRLLRRAKLLGRLAWHLRAAGLLDTQPPVVADQLGGALALAESRTRSALWELDRLAWALGDLAGTPLVLMKGCAYVIAGMPNAGGRSFADVDLLVPEAELPTVERRLRQRGWEDKQLTPYDDLYYRRWAHELPPMTHVERDVEVDLHHGILMRTARLKPSSPLLFAAARSVPDSRYRVLGPADMVLHAIVHLFHGGEMDDALRELVDIDDLLQHFAATEPGFWEGFWPRAEALDLARPAFYALRYSSRLLGTPVPATLLAASLVAAPPTPLLRFMDWLVPRALFPQHPDASSHRAEFARLMLYIRSHWVKMPPLMLARHLGYKLYVRFGGGRPDGM